MAEKIWVFTVLFFLLVCLGEILHNIKSTVQKVCIMKTMHCRKCKLVLSYHRMDMKLQDLRLPTHEPSVPDYRYNRASQGPLPPSVLLCWLRECSDL